ncbi:MAG: glycosyl hydrolase family 8, partial [Mycobacteriales bacterium]
DPDGRVVRHDQGGDTVSEGQAYAMLVAVGVGDRGAFDRTWRWTRQHLARPDGLLSYLWRDGRVSDPMAASDADLETAWALALADRRWHRHGAEARHLAAAVLAGEVVRDDAGRPFLSAGPWAQASRTVEPGYWALPAYDALGRLTGDRRWRELRDAALAALPARQLPTDWATVGAGLQPAPPPSGGPVRSSLDGLRAVVWVALDAPAAAVRWRPLLDDGTAALSRQPDGTPVGGDRHPLGAVAAAAADPGHRRQDLDQAAAVERSYPGYYGSAWVALGRLLLSSDRLTG